MCPVSRVLRTVSLVIVYLAALGSAGAGDVAIGLALALLIQWSIRPPAPVSQGVSTPSPPSRALWLLPFLVVLVGRSFLGALSFLRYLVRPSALSHAGLVEVPYGNRTEVGVAVTGLCISLVPGSVVLQMERDRRVLIVQVADARDPDRVRAEQAGFYERWQRRVVP